jgi:hypothetical protein
VRGRLNTWLLVLLGVCALSLWFGKDLLRQDTDGSKGSQSATTGSPGYGLPLDETPVHLVVLNGTGHPGLAREFSLLLGRVGCVIESVGNASRGDFARSLLVNRRLSDERASELARLMGGIRTIREWDDRRSEDAVLVLGADHEALKATLADLRTVVGKVGP